MTVLDAGSTVSQAVHAGLEGLQALPVAARPGGALAGLRGLGAARADRLGRVVVDRPDRGLRRRPAGRPGGRARPEQPAGRRDRGAGERPVLPVDHLPLPADPVRRPGLGLLDVHPRRAAARGQGRPRAEHRDDRRHRHQHRPRARPQEGAARALAGQDRAGAELLRALLHRAQPRPPRPRRHPGGPGQLPGRRVAVRVPAAHRPRLAAQRVEPGEAAVRAARQVALVDPQRRAQLLADVAGALGRADRRRSAGRCCRSWWSRPSSASACSRS